MVSVITHEIPQRPLLGLVIDLWRGELLRGRWSDLDIFFLRLSRGAGTSQRAALPAYPVGDIVPVTGGMNVRRYLPLLLMIGVVFAMGFLLGNRVTTVHGK